MSSLHIAILCVAAAAAMTGVASALAAASLRIWSHRMSAWSAAAQARMIYLAMALPALVMLALVPMALSPLFGWIADHCLDVAVVHNHPHICSAAHQVEMPGLLVIALALWLCARVVTYSTAQLWRCLAAQSARRTLRRLSTRIQLPSGRGPVTAYILPIAQPQAFVMGFLRPKLFISQSLLAAPHAAASPAILGHEICHVENRDPLRRWLVTWLLPFHLPLVAGWLQRKMLLVTEMVADEAAAADTSPTEVAAAIVHMARHAQREAPSARFAHLGLAHIMGSAHPTSAQGLRMIEARIANLLCPSPRKNGVSLGMLAATGAACVALALLAAHEIHHGVETLLGLLGG